jgi:hypothetical protein
VVVDQGDARRSWVGPLDGRTSHARRYQRAYAGPNHGNADGGYWEFR